MNDDALVFVALGGEGEIGMNLNLYGCSGKWLMVDLGMTFADGSLPGVDLIVPDPRFIAERRGDLLGLVLTHAHEDHIGAVPYLWRQLRCPVYATPFTASMLRSKLEEADLIDDVPLHVLPLSGGVELGPFSVRYITMTHSIPEPNSLAITTPFGTILHSGDWKLDPTPLIGEVTDEEALRELGDAGVLAMISDSTNILSEGASGSELQVRESLSELVPQCAGRVAITTFASNVARVATVAKVAADCGRHLMVAGRSLHRAIAAAQENGYLDELGELVSEEDAAHLPPDKVLYLFTGSQGEPRAMMSRIAAGDHKHLVLEDGDTVIFSSKIIPGNEKPIAAVHDMLWSKGVRVWTEKDHFVHVSGHPCRDEVKQLYEWVRPQIAVPVHGEARHLIQHLRLAKEWGVPEPVQALNGDVVRLAPGPAKVVDQVPVGRMAVDGDWLVDHEAESLGARRRMMHGGYGGVALAMDELGGLLADPRIVFQGLPDDPLSGELAAASVAAVRKALEALSNGKARDDDAVKEAARVALRRTCRRICGKRPVVDVQVLRLPSR